MTGVDDAIHLALGLVAHKGGELIRKRWEGSNLADVRKSNPGAPTEASRCRLGLCGASSSTHMRPQEVKDAGSRRSFTCLEVSCDCAIEHALNHWVAPGIHAVVRIAGPSAVRSWRTACKGHAQACTLFDAATEKVAVKQVLKFEAPMVKMFTQQSGKTSFKCHPNPEDRLVRRSGQPRPPLAGSGEIREVPVKV
jgi:hypothetical protein